MATQTVFQSGEAEVPLIPEDIEVSDRLYCTRYSTTVFGRAVIVSSERIAIKLDKGGIVNIMLTPRNPALQQLRSWGKAFPLDQVEIGSLVSVLDNNDNDEQERFYGTVKEYVPELSITIEYEDRFVKHCADPENGLTLESVMKYWEMEA